MVTLQASVTLRMAEPWAFENVCRKVVTRFGVDNVLMFAIASCIEPLHRNRNNLRAPISLRPRADS